MRSDKNELLARLMEIREACEVATSTDDTNLNLIIEEINRLVCLCIVQLKEK